MSFFQKREE
jgi:hypothetical protein